MTSNARNAMEQPQINVLNARQTTCSWALPAFKTALPLTSARRVCAILANPLVKHVSLRLPVIVVSQVTTIIKVSAISYALQAPFPARTINAFHTIARPFQIVTFALLGRCSIKEFVIRTALPQLVHKESSVSHALVTASRAISLVAQAVLKTIISTMESATNLALQGLSSLA